ncbi:hypothetical protein J4408_00510 [Candidatus Pacearchaeota archaeon]|nr:hypothetical protein [Candidatus Pacearchaeota archaeon]
MTTVQYKFPGETEKKLIEVSQLDQNAMYLIGHPKFENAKLEQLRYTFPIVLGSKIEDELEELAKIGGIWSESGRPILNAVVYSYGRNNNFVHNLNNKQSSLGEVA